MQITRHKPTCLCFALTPDGRLRTQPHNTLVFAATLHTPCTSGAQPDTTEKVEPDVHPVCPWGTIPRSSVSTTSCLRPHYRDIYTGMDNLFVHVCLASGTVSRLYRHIRQAAIPARVASGMVDFCVTGSEPASVIWTLAGECSAFCVQRECVFMLRGRYVL